MTNCPPRYQNIQCESFGDRRKITSQLLRQFCKNDAYLKEQIDLLWDTTDPETRKRFYPPDYMDIPNSFGVGEKKLSTVEKAGFDQADTVYNFNTIDKYRYIFDLDFGNDSVGEMYNDGIDTQCIDINADSLLDFTNNYDKQMLGIVKDGETTTLRPPLTTGTYKEIIHHEAKYETVYEVDNEVTIKQNRTYVTKKKNVESLGKAKKDAHFYGAYKNWHCNCHWYNGFDRSKNYHIKAKWKKDPYGEDKKIVKKYGRIPSVCHAQTFKAQNSGRISKVSLHMQGSKSATSPCTVEIRTTTKTGKPTEKVLARCEKKFSGEDIVAFEFNTKASVTKGEHYAIVVRSPFSHFENCYRIGGWTTGCFSSASKYYGDGSSYTSTDNGHTWKKNGKTSDKKSYGSHYYDWGINQPPVDFAFEVYVQKVTKKPIKEKVPKTKKSKNTVTKKRTKNILVEKAYNETHTWQYIYFKQGSYYVHLKPIRTNPIDRFFIEANYVDGSNNISNGSKYWTWEYYSPKDGWTKVPNGYIEFDNNNTNYTVLKLRVRCDITFNTFGGVVTRDDAQVTQAENTIIDDLVNTKQCIKDTGLDFLRDFKVNIFCKKPSEGYLRTKYYTPNHTNMLGASLWSEVNATGKTFGNAKMEIDVIHEKQNVEHIKFYDLSILKDTLKQINSQTGEIEYIQPQKDVFCTNQQITFFDDLSNLINDYEVGKGGNAINFSYGKDMIIYVANDKINELGFIEWCMKQVVPVYFLPLSADSDLGIEEDLTFFATVQLAHLPSYPLLGGDIGDEDIIIDPKNFTVPDTYGFVYNLPKSIKGVLSSILVTYKTGANITMDEGEEDDDEGYEVNPQDVEETVETTLTGITLAQTSTGIYLDSSSPSLGLVSGLFKVNESDTYPSSHIDYGVTSDGLAIVFNSHSKLVNKLFPNRYTTTPASPGATDNITGVALNNVDNPYAYATTDSLGLISGDVTVSDFELKVDLTTKTYQEFIDFEVDYDNGILQFYNNNVLIHGDFKMTYNPLWVRGLSVDDFPLKMDLWKETYSLTDEGAYKQVFNKSTASYVDKTYYEKTSIDPYTKEKDTLNTYYQFKTTVAPRDNIRKLVVNEGDNSEFTLEEDKQYFVDYDSNTITLYTNEVSEGDNLTVHYTPNLTDNGLALGYRISRPRYNANGVQVAEGDENYLSAQPKDEDDVWIGMNYFTYRT